MKKILLAALAAVILIGYPLSTYLLGVRAENASRAWVETLSAAVPYFRVAKNDYRRSFLKATHIVELEAALPGMDTPFVVTMQNEVEHGPFPGFNSLGVARVTHTLVLPAKVQQQLAKVLGDKPPLSAVTMLKLGGGGSTRVTSPAFTYKDEKGEASWQGIDGQMDFSKGYERVNYTFAAPGLSARMVDGSEMKIGKISATGQQEKIAQTESLYTGNSTVTVESLTASSGPQTTFSLSNISYSADLRLPVPSFLDVSGKVAAQNIKFGAEDWGTFEYAFSAKHLHLQSVDAFSKTMREAYASSARRGQSAQSATQLQTTMLDAFKKHGGTLLKNDPVIELDRLRLGTERDYLSMNGSIRFVGVTDADIKNPMGLIPKINARAEIVLAETMLTRIAGKASSTLGRNARGSDPATAEAPAGNDVLPMVNAQTENAVAQGYIIRGGGTLRSTITYADGKLSINGRTVDSMK